MSGSTYCATDVSQVAVAGDVRTTSTIASAQDKYNPPYNAITRKMSLPVGVINIICTSLEGTALTIPYTIAKCGVIGGPLLIIFFGCATVSTLSFLCITARKLRAASYTEVIYRLYGQSLGHSFSLLLFFVLFAILVGFLILARQILMEILELMTGMTSCPSVAIMLGFSVVCLPLMLAENLHKLRYTCYLGFASIITVLLCLVHTARRAPVNFHMTKVKLLPHNLQEVLESLPVFTMLFLSHFNVMGVYTQLHHPSPRRMFQIIFTSVAVLTLLFSMFGVVGYFIFLQLFDGTAFGNILQPFPVHHRTMLIGRVCLLVTLICTFPVMLVPARAILIELYDDLILYFACKHHPEGNVALCQYHAALMLENEHSLPVHVDSHHRAPHYPIHLPPIDSLMLERSPESLSSRAESEAESFVTVSTSSTQSQHGSQQEGYSRASDEDVGLRFEGVESHWRDWQAPSGNIQDLHRVTSFERMVAESDYGTEGKEERHEEEHKWDEETGLEMLSTEESQRLTVDEQAPEKQNGRGNINPPVEDSDAGMFPLFATLCMHIR